MDKLSVLAQAEPKDVRSSPFPYLVVRNALPADLADQLRSEFPPVEKFLANSSAKYTDMSNRRLDIAAANVDEKLVGSLWKRMVLHHVTQSFFNDFVRVFGPSVKKTYPNFERDFGELRGLRAGMPEGGDKQGPDVLLDAAVGLNTPVTDRPSTVRGAHIDRAAELFAGLLYLRHPDDRSSGGSFEIHRWNGPRAFLKNEVPPNLTEKVDEVPYEHNTLVMFVNSIDSLHAVSPRSVTNSPRQFIVVSGGMRRPLINHDFYQIGGKPKDGRGAEEPVSRWTILKSRARHAVGL